MLQTRPPHIPSREPIFNIPPVVVITIGALVVLHAMRSLLSDETDIRLLLEFAFIPAQWGLAWDPSQATDIMSEVAAQGGADSATQLALARYVLSNPEPSYWSVLTYAFLHGSWTHILLNSVWLAAFGTPIARRCGAVRFVALAVLSAVGGAAAHFIANSTSVMPMIGASAAVSGMMGAASRFVFGGRVPAFAPNDWSLPEDQPRLSLLGVVRNSRAALFLGIWFVTNLLFGIIAGPLGMTDASIAWEAHIGGFLVGLLLFPLFDRAEPLHFRAT